MVIMVLLVFLALMTSTFFLTVSITCCFSFFFSSRRRHTRSTRDWSSDVCSSDLQTATREHHPGTDEQEQQPAGGDRQGIGARERHHTATLAWRGRRWLAGWHAAGRSTEARAWRAGRRGRRRSRRGRGGGSTGRGGRRSASGGGRRSTGGRRGGRAGAPAAGHPEHLVL